jgi:hypothetical protein
MEKTNLCWKIHNKYVFYVNIHIFVLKYLVQIQIIQNQFKISEGDKWNSHQMPCVYSSRMVKNYLLVSSYDSQQNNIAHSC